MPPDRVHRTVEAVWRMESARLIAGLVRLVGDVGLAEELAQDALVSALEKWPESGVPDNPGAWLTAAARNKAIDEIRRRAMRERRLGDLDADDASRTASLGHTGAAADAVDDDVLRLMFIACHPIVPMDSRVALTLKALGGLSTLQIARAFLVPEPTAAQRIVRAKRTLSDSGLPFELPPVDELEARLASVLAVVYAIFNEGYSASKGEELVRRDLCEEALRLGRMLAALAPGEPEAHGLVSLMEIQASRLRARVGESGESVLLLDQDRAKWDQLLIGRGLAALERARALGEPAGPYVLQAEIAACHARARTPEDTDWARIAALYGVLSASAPSPVVELNRAVALSMVLGAATGLSLLDGLPSSTALSDYYLLPAARADMLARLGRHEEASAEFARAAALTDNLRQREHLLARAAKERPSERLGSR